MVVQTSFIQRKELVNWPGKDGSTPLHLAAGAGHVSTVEALINHGADMRTQLNNGQTTLHLAAKYLNCQKKPMKYVNILFSPCIVRKFELCPVIFFSFYFPVYSLLFYCTPLNNLPVPHAGSKLFYHFHCNINM